MVFSNRKKNKFLTFGHKKSQDRTSWLNKETGVLVFFHDIKVADSKTIYNKLMAMGNYKAERFVLPKELENKTACPVMSEDSFSYKFSRGIQRIFN